MFFTKSEGQTVEIAQKLAKFLKESCIITLEGSLGVGKTSFAKGIARGLGIKEPITSPTFTIIKEYMGDHYPFYHIDAYRLEHAEEDIGLDEYFYSKGISVVEWAQFIEDDLPEHYLQIHLTYVSEETRKLKFHPIGDQYVTITEQLMEQIDEEFKV